MESVRDVPDEIELVDISGEEMIGLVKAIRNKRKQKEKKKEKLRTVALNQA